ncbi:MAG: dihydrolipoamide acetyltransferase family protein [Acidimicrobiia bacterium]
MIEFVLPSLGADMDRAKLNCWLVKPGDTVHRGQIIAEVETDKAVLEVECWDEGVVEELVLSPGPTPLPVGTLLAHIRPLEGAQARPSPKEPPMEEADIVPPSTRPSPRRETPSPPVRHLAHELGVDMARVAGSGGVGEITREDVRRAAATLIGQEHRVKASPLARHLAGETGLDLSTVAASGLAGLVTAKDVRAVGQSPSAPPGPAVESTEPEGRAETMRRAIARSMARSKREIPHYYLANHIDLDRALRWLTARNDERPISGRILPAALLLKATALALRKTPDLNGRWVDEGFRPSDAVHLGVAISLREGGLVAPAIHDADRLDIDEMMASLRDLVNRARSWRLRSSEMSDPTITVTNLGERGVETAFPVIIPPQVAIVGFGRVVDLPVAIDGQPVVHPVVHATLAGDHRVTDGHRGALFLDALDRLLQEPESL